MQWNLKLRTKPLYAEPGTALKMFFADKYTSSRPIVTSTWIVHLNNKATPGRSHAVYSSGSDVHMTYRCSLNRLVFALVHRQLFSMRHVHCFAAASVDVQIMHYKE